MNDRQPSAAEMHATRHTAAVIDVSDRMQLELSGDNRQAFLHNFCTHDIKALRIGAGCEAFLCNIKGRILGHVFVFAGESSLWIEALPGNTLNLVNHLRKYLLLENLTLHDWSQAYGELLVVGPQAPDLVARLAGARFLHDWNHAQLRLPSLEDNGVWMKRADVLGTPCLWLSTARELLPRLQEQLLTAGAIATSSTVFETMRIEAGLPRYGIDLTDENLAQEANRTQQAISFTKGCYLGQEPIARLHAMGHVNKELKRFEVFADSAPSSSTGLLNPTDSTKEIGRLTSCAWSPTRECFVALGIVRSAFSAVGTELRLSQSSALARVL